MLDVKLGRTVNNDEIGEVQEHSKREFLFISVHDFEMADGVVF